MEPAVVDMLITEMEEAGIKFVGGESAAIEEAGGKKTLVLKDGTKLDGYDEVLFAIGRDPVTDSLNLPAAGIDVGPGGHVVVDDASRTTADGVYAVGDVIGKVDLTPVAIAAGRLLSDRLFGGAALDDTKMDYDMVPTVVFSHPAIAAMGLTEAEAIEKYGEATVTTHQTTFVNMLYSASSCTTSSTSRRRAKLVCIGEEQKIIGLHMIGLAVDEILQGFGVAMKMGATKADFDSVVAIHPTSAEELVTIPPWQAKYKMGH